MKTELLLGDEAIGLGAIHAGIGGAFAYPGTPSTEIFEYIQAARVPHISAMWSANEKVAYEEALGMSYAGKRAIVSMKHVGLNVAADPFINSALTGVNGGLVLVVADDPSMHSSQNEQDSRYLGDFARIPIIEPGNQQECYDLTRHAFELSERTGLPVMLRIVTRLAHSRSVVKVLDEPPEPPALKPLPPKENWVLIPANARRRWRQLLDLQPELLDIAQRSEINQLALAGRRGIITAGIAANYVREVLGEELAEWSLLKIGLYPIPASLVRELVDHCDEIFVIEEGYPFIESHLAGLLGVPGKTIRGKLNGALPLDGELSPDNIAPALGKPVAAHPAPQQVPGRPPMLCIGCPHRDTFAAMLEATRDQPEAILFSDIGCYTLGCLPPYEAVHSCVDMGASISMAHGAAQAGRHPVLCTIGDSTFTHSGMTGLIGAARADANMTVFVLDNATVAMTGGQQTMAAGEDLMRVIRGLGVSDDHLHVMDPLAKYHEQNVELIRSEIAHRGLSVIVARRPCIQIKKPKKAKKDTRPAACAAGQ